MIDFQILISTMNNNIFLKNNLPDIESFIINQIIDESLEPYSADNVATYREKGLSKSRNRALSHASASYCLLSDDDVKYKENVEQIIVDAFKKNPTADIITFQIETPEKKPYKNYAKESYWHTIRSLMKVSSVEIAIKKSSLASVDLAFDENFGLGTTMPTGEEVIFLTDALKQGLKIMYMPIPIVIHPIESSGKEYHRKELIEAKGAMFYRIFGIKAYLINFIFSLKKHKLSSLSLISFYRVMNNGISKYKEQRDGK